MAAETWILWPRHPIAGFYLYILSLLLITIYDTVFSSEVEILLYVSRDIK